jgi:hypothetical protein
MRNVIRFALAAMFAVSLVPVAGHAEHCPNGVFVFFGVDTGVEHPVDGGTIKQGQNPGATGCTVGNDEELNTHVIVPGAPHAIVGTTISNQFGGTPVGTIEIDGDVIDLTFTAYNSARGRWEADGVAVPAGASSIVASVWLEDNEDDVRTVSYRAAA